jgi:hypothetical protein
MGRSSALKWESITHNNSEPIVFTTIEEADLFCRSGDQFTKAGGGGCGRYTCQYHENCRMYRRVKTFAGGIFQAQEYGVHSKELKVLAYGIPKALRPYFDKYLLANNGPWMCVTKVKEELRADPRLGHLWIQLEEMLSDKNKLKLQLKSRKRDLKQHIPHEVIKTRKSLEDFLVQYLVGSKL